MAGVNGGWHGHRAEPTRLVTKRQQFANSLLPNQLLQPEYPLPFAWFALAWLGDLAPFFDVTFYDAVAGGSR